VILEHLLEDDAQTPDVAVLVLVVVVDPLRTHLQHSSDPCLAILVGVGVDLRDVEVTYLGDLRLGVLHDV